jgi:pyruvate dehydrogenase E2 component (dihydrolipoamide acetyltransferase)
MVAYDRDVWEVLADGSRRRRRGDTKAVVTEFDATAGATDLAAELGIDLAAVTGSGAGGRITKSDVQAAADA